MIRPTIEALIARTRRILLEGVPLRRSLESGFARLLAGMADGLHGRVEWIAAQVMPDRASGGPLRGWARLYFLDPIRKGKASGLVLFGVDEGSVGDPAIPLGHRVRDDYGHAYVVIEYQPVVYGAGFRTVIVEAEETGAAQNLGNEEPIRLLEALPGVNSSGVVYGDLFTSSPPFSFEGGADEEKDRELRTRVLERSSSEPLGGAPGDYVILARRGGAPIAWERPEEDGPGTVKVYVGRLTDEVAGVDPGGKISGLTTSDAADVQAYVDEHCPATVDVTVASVATSTPSLIVSISPDTAENRAAVELELRALFVREAIANGPGNTIPRSRIGEAISLAGVTHVISSPAAAGWTASTVAVLADANITWT